MTPVLRFPIAISAGGIEMDLPGHKGYSATLNGNRDELIAFRFQDGLIGSALEHAIPEQMFVTAENPGEAISAVKALSKAAQAGQRIYHITQANQATALPNIHHSASTMAEIRAAVNAGKEVYTHTDAVSVPGWSGAGYVVFDPVTGDGAYKIAGGKNGAFFSGMAFGFALIAAIFLIGAIYVATLPEHYGAGAVPAAFVFSQALIPLYALHMEVYGRDEKLHDCWKQGLGWSHAPVAILSALVEFGLVAAGGAFLGEALWGELRDL